MRKNGTGFWFLLQGLEHVPNQFLLGVVDSPPFLPSGLLSKLDLHPMLGPEIARS